jgi:hypothetical protein
MTGFCHDFVWPTYRILNTLRYNETDIIYGNILKPLLAAQNKSLSY